MTEQLRTVLQEFRQGLESLYGDRLVRLVLFGSQARGEAGERSDVDVMLVLRGRVEPGDEIQRTSALRSSLCLKHDAVISCVYVSETEYLTEMSPLLRNVHREGVAM